MPAVHLLVDSHHELVHAKQVVLPNPVIPVVESVPVVTLQYACVCKVITMRA